MGNRLVLSGSIIKTPIRKVSPNGIPHCQFLLEHRSQQIEAGLSRQSWCIMPVVVSRQNDLVHSIKKGSNLQVSGFLNTHTKRNGISQLVLHASEIKLID
ncbi:primosomal replication protein N [Orbaceae bacterium ac157xtp]